MVQLEWSDFITNFVTLWVMLDPVSTVPIFLAMTPGMTPARRRVVATKAVLIAAAVLLCFIVGGQFLLEALGIPIYSFQMAGGVILFLYALRLFFGQNLPKKVAGTGPMETDESIVVFPLAIPAIAGPGAMLAVVLLTDNDRYSAVEQADTVIVMLVVFFALWLAMLAANPISRIIGATGAEVLSRIMGLILAAVAADNVLRGARTFMVAAGQAAGGG